jgi:hypothetical protein
VGSLSAGCGVDLDVGYRGCGAGAGLQERPTPEPLATKTEPAQTFVSADGVHFVPGRPVQRAAVS